MTKKTVALLTVGGVWTALCALPLAAQSVGADAIILEPILVEAGDEKTEVLGPDAGLVASGTLSGSKTATDVLSLPQSVSVATRDQMDQQGAKSVGAALRYSPGIRAEAYGADTRYDWFFIRGFSANAQGLYLDGLQLRSQAFANYKVENFGLERQEVLMGPNSALYGAGSPGGLVNLVSKRAQKDQFTRFGVGISEPEGLELRLDANRQLNEAGTVFGRIVMLGRMSKTQVNHAEDDRVYVAPSLTWAPQEGTELTLLAQYQSDETGTVTSFLPYEATVNTASFGRVPRDFFTGDTNFDSYERRQMMVGYSFSHAFDNGLKFSQDARFSKVEVDYRTLYGAGLASSYFPSMPDQLLVRQLMATGDQVSSFQFDNRLETEFSTGQVDHSLLVGLDYRYEDFRNRAVYGGDPSGNYFVIDITDPHYGIAVTAPAYTTNSTTETRRTGIYLQDQMTVGGHTDVWAGLRYDWVSAKTTNHLTGGRTDADYRELTGRIGVSHELRDGMRLYASYATSFDPVPNFDPETAEQYEIGLKYETADGGLRFSGAVFDLARQNVVTNHPTRGREQTGETRSRGLELQAQGDLGNGWQAVAALTAMKLEVTQTSEPSELGNVPVGVPETMASLWLTREFGGRFEGLRIGGGVRYTGTSHADKGNAYAVPAYTVADLGLGYETGNMEFSLNISNLFDKTYVASCAGINACYYGAGRTITADLTMKW